MGKPLPPLTGKKSKPQLPPTDLAGHMPRLSKVQEKSPVVQIARGQIKNAPYNPRHITKHAAKKLEAKLRKRGLVQTLTWNKRTGNLVGGHQRIKLVDAIEGKPDYSLLVSVVDLSPKDEAELNVELNNPALGGEYDLAKLEALAEEFDIDLTETGFDRIDLEVMFDGTDTNLLDDMPAEEAEEPAAVSDDLDKLAEINEQERAKKAASIAELKERKKVYKATQDAQDDMRFFTMIVFKNNEEREHFLDRVECAPTDKYIDGRKLLTYLAESR